MRHDLGLLTLAVRKQAQHVFDSIADLPVRSPSKRFRLSLYGLPQALATVSAIRLGDGSARVLVHALDGVPLTSEARVDIDPIQADLTVEDDDTLYGKNRSCWTPAPGGMQPEIIDIDDAGNDVVRLVNTDRYTHQMTCICGNVRYAMKSSIHQVDRCRPCGRKQRHAYQVSWQREKRAAKRPE